MSAAAVLLMLWAGPAIVRAQSVQPEPAPLPDPAFGDRWVYRHVDAYTGIEEGRYSLTYLRRDAKTMTYRVVNLKNNAARFEHRTHDLGWCFTNALGQHGCGSAYSFPLVVGKKSSFSRRPIPGQRGYDGLDCVVEAYEPVKLIAGTFDAFRLECQGLWRVWDSDFAWSGQLRHTYWYSPALNAQVKSFERAYDVKGKPTTRDIHELVSYTAGSENADPTGDKAAAAAAAAASAPKAMPAEFVVDGTSFAGEFRAPAGGKYSGAGRVRWANGDEYEGTLDNGVRVGTGRFSWANGQRYEGPWRDDRPEGRGKLTFANGNVYDGDVVAGVPDGEGTMRYASGDVYVGTMKDGLPHGVGTLNSASGDRYVGDWKAGRKDGRGTLTWTTGDRFEGTFANDERVDGVLLRKSP